MLGDEDINQRLRIDEDTPLVTDKDRDAKIEIRSGLAADPDRAADLGVALETLTHEFALHANKYTGFIRKLRGNTEMHTLSEELREQLDPMSKKGTLTSDYQQYRLATGSNVAFNVLNQFLEGILREEDRAAEADSFAHEIGKDVKDHENRAGAIPEDLAGHTSLRRASTAG